MKVLGRAILWIGGLIVLASMLGSHETTRSSAQYNAMPAVRSAPQYSRPPESSCKTVFDDWPERQRSTVTTVCK